MITEISIQEYCAFLLADLMTFIHASFHELNPDKEFFPSIHLEAIAAKLQACLEGKIKRLIINLPPRSLKSHSVSIAFVAWLLGLDPTLRIICASYGQDLADKLSRDCRALMVSPFYRTLFPHTVLSRDKQSVSEFVTTQQGYRLSTSVGGVLTGRGADFIILDDPLKPDDALSESRRKSVNEWNDNTLVTRLDNKNTGCIIVVMQRLHQDDLVGHLLEQGEWEVLSFPAIAEKDEIQVIATPWGTKVYQRKEGEVLDPARESLAILTEIRKSIGEYNFQSQYQQNPTPPGGMIVKTRWLRYYDPQEKPPFWRILQSWDTANKAGELNDYSVCTTWGEYEKRYYLIDVWRGRVDYPGLKKAVVRQAELHYPSIISIEDKASGTQLIQELKYENFYYSVKPYEPPPGMDKTMRLYALTTLFEDGRVLLPKSAHWLVEYLLELTSFPGSKHDDQVDSTTQALEHLRSKGPSLYDYL